MAETTQKKAVYEPIRMSLNKPFGELILDVTGNPFVQKFYAAKKDAAIPAGQIAENLGVIDSETKTALLLAQAAERVLELSEQIDSLYRPHKHRSGFNRVSSRAVSADDPVFRHIGTPTDPDNVQMAQASWQLAQIYLNLERGGQAENPGQRVFSAAFVDAFKKQARGNFEQAADMLDEKSYADAAYRLRLAAQRYAVGDAVPETPHVFALHLRDDETLHPKIRAIAGRLATITQDQRGAERAPMQPGQPLPTPQIYVRQGSAVQV